MTDDLAIKALSTKKKGKLTPLETQQISDLQKVYGKNNVISAIRFAKSAHIAVVAKMLLQHCGVRPVLPPSVRDLIPDKASAEKILPLEKFQVACRLGEATLQVESELEESTRRLSSLWKSKVRSVEVSKVVASSIKGAVRKFGVQLAEHGAKVIPENVKVPEDQLINLYKAWLENASIKNWGMLEDITKELGNPNETANWGIPNPMPIRIEKYFRAKANRDMTTEEASKLWSLLREHKTEKIIHSMSCIPSAEFSLHKLEKLLIPKEFWDYYELDTEERIEDEVEDELAEELLSEADHTVASPNDARIYDYSIIDEDSLEGDDFLDDYDLEEIEAQIDAEDNY